MKLARVFLRDSVFLARIEGDSAILLLEESSHPLADVLIEALAGDLDLTSDGDKESLQDVRLLSPVFHPRKLLGVGLNYADHAEEAQMELPSAPIFFAMTTNAITGPEDPIRFETYASKQVDYEVELAVVIGSRASKVDERDALSHVFGYTVCNDVSARDVQFGDPQWMRGKSFDTFCPLGPVIVTADEVPDVQDIELFCRVNGETLQAGSTQKMIFGVSTLISFISQTMTLEPGDVIATGTPSGVGFARTPPIFLKTGDVVESEVRGIGVLRNTVVVD
jgi:2-keto-4-pentenoate hydratase/2-oxohepta-3-ene-1,7-dioic acid hydratase in catechol pathway